MLKEANDCRFCSLTSFLKDGNVLKYINSQLALSRYKVRARNRSMLALVSTIEMHLYIP